ncbi:MAG: hypothetical protein QOH88_3310 [Verrucomicrobiota bacterium]|jgi:hypothetical protein
MKPKIHISRTSAILTILLAAQLQVSADTVADWNAIAERSILTAKHPPPVAALDLAITQVAIYDAITAIDGRYQPYYVRIPNATGSMDAAGAKAGHDILVNLFPAQSSQLDADYEAYLAQHNISLTDPGVTVGAQAAAGIAALRSNDGRFPSSQPPFTGGTGPGQWRPTPSYEPGAPASYTPGLTPWVAAVRPFTFNDVGDYAADGPPALTSAQYTEDFNEVKSVGSRTSTTRTPAQTQLAYFWADSGPLMWQRGLRDIASRYALSIGDSARMFALVDLAAADAQIACWNSKYEYNFWRPITAITLADQDGNPNTEADPNWRPLINTPNFPEYTSGHTTSSAAAAEMLETVLGTKKVEFTITTTNGLANPKTQTYSNLTDPIRDVIDARICAGIHYRTSDMHGVALGKRVAKHAFKNYLRPIR